MSGEVKFYRVEGRMLIGHDKFPRWQKFAKDVRALKPEHAVEKVLSELGSNHKVRRDQVEILKVYEISVEEVKDRSIAGLANLTRWYKL